MEKIIIKKKSRKEKDFSVSLGVRLYPDQYTRIGEIVNKTGKTVSEVFRELLDYVLDKVVIEGEENEKNF